MTTRRALSAAIAGAAAALSLAGAALAAPGDAVTVRDADDTPVVLDIARVRLEENRSKRLRATITMYETWTVADLVSASGPSGSICLKLWTTRTPSSEPPNYLVCASPTADGSRLQGVVMRDSGRGPPARTAGAAVSGPRGKDVVIAFTDRSIRSPARVRFAAEASQAAGCPPPRGCVDVGPDAPRTRAFELRD